VDWIAPIESLKTYGKSESGKPGPSQYMFEPAGEFSENKLTTTDSFLRGAVFNAVIKQIEKHSVDGLSALSQTNSRPE